VVYENEDFDGDRLREGGANLEACQVVTEGESKNRNQDEKAVLFSKKLQTKKARLLSRPPKALIYD